MQWKKNTNLQKPKNLSWQPLPFLLLVSVSSGKILSALKMPKELTAEQDTFVGQFSLDVKPLTGKRIERGLKLLHFVLCRAFADPWRHQGMRKYILQQNEKIYSTVRDATEMLTQNSTVQDTTEMPHSHSIRKTQLCIR